MPNQDVGHGHPFTCGSVQCPRCYPMPTRSVDPESIVMFTDEEMAAMPRIKMVPFEGDLDVI